MQKTPKDMQDAPLCEGWLEAAGLRELATDRRALYI